MGNTNIDFHATPEEIIFFVNRIIEEYNLKIISTRSCPKFEFKVIEQSNFYDNKEYLCSSRFIILCEQIPIELSNDYNVFFAQNRDNLIIQIGESKSEYMIESTMGTICQDSEKIRVWKSVIKQFKKKLYQGVWVNNPYRKAKQYYKNLYFSEGALIAYKSGVVMKAFAGWNEYHFDEDMINRTK